MLTASRPQTTRQRTGHLSASRRRNLRNFLSRVDTLIDLIDAGADAEELLAECVPLIRAAWRSAGLASASLKKGN